MIQDANALELRFPDCGYGLSARRLWEHTELGQINVFKHTISERSELNVAEAFIDLVGFDGDSFALLGMTLEDVFNSKTPSTDGPAFVSLFKKHVKTEAAIRFISAVGNHLSRCSIRQGVRNQHQPFMPPASAEDSFGVLGIFSTLQRRLLAMGNAKATGNQWLRTIENYQKKGLRIEELKFAALTSDLVHWHEGDGQISAHELAGLCNFKELRLSVIPVVLNAERQLRFSALAPRVVKRTRKLPRAQIGQKRGIAEFDQILGYRVERVVHPTLWGTESHWQAVNHMGEVLTDGEGQLLFSTSEAAAVVAANHAKRHFPKRVALGRYGHLAWTGGESYREWLITLPYLPASYLSGHFKVRNVLAHIRCDIREGAEGERVLMLQEVQSDWAQRARRAISTGDSDHDDEMPPPFMKEWPALVMKLALLHAAHQALDAVAWTRGAHQVARYKGLGAAGLTELYDRTLPREVNRIVKPFSAHCEMLEVFLPVNFRIEQAEDGYRVYDENGNLHGAGSSLQDARRFIPDGGHERLDQVHGLKLPNDLREKVIELGFPAWGQG